MTSEPKTCRVPGCTNGPQPGHGLCVPHWTMLGHDGWTVWLNANLSRLRGELSRDQVEEYRSRMCQELARRPMPKLVIDE